VRWLIPSLAKDRSRCLHVERPWPTQRDAGTGSVSGETTSPASEGRLRRRPGRRRERLRFSRTSFRAVLSVRAGPGSDCLPCSARARPFRRPPPPVAPVWRGGASHQRKRPTPKPGEAPTPQDTSTLLPRETRVGWGGLSRLLRPDGLSRCGSAPQASKTRRLDRRLLRQTGARRSRVWVSIPPPLCR
jgi:hypothetical protein